MVLLCYCFLLAETAGLREKNEKRDGDESIVMHGFASSALVALKVA